jgi:hypothetical protein
MSIEVARGFHTADGEYVYPAGNPNRDEEMNLAKVTESKSNRIMREMLETATKNVTADRQGTYGLPLDNHTCTGEFWTTYLKRRGLLKPDAFVNGRDVCNLNSLQKLSRDAFCQTTDNQVDIAGYAANAEACRVT